MLPSFINTKEELELFLKRLRVFSKNTYKLNIDQEKALNTIFSEEEKYFLIEESKKSGIDLQNVVETLKKELDKVPTINITLAFKPTVNEQYKIIQLIKKYSPDSVFKFYYNPEIIGGVILENKGRFLDLSIKNKYEHKL